MGTIALFVTIFLLLAIFALIFVCYRAGRNSRQQAFADEEAGAMRRATIVLSIVPGSAAAAAALAAQQQSQHSSGLRTLPPANRKTPTPPTIIRNLPVVIWQKPKRAADQADKAPTPGAAQGAAPAGAADADTDAVQDTKGKDATAAAATAAAATATHATDTHPLRDASRQQQQQQQEDDEGGQGCMCVICCCEYEAGESVKLLPCLHMYHQMCIDAWLARSHVCPVCQADVIRAAGLSAAVDDWSLHTTEVVNSLSGTPHHYQDLPRATQQQQPHTTQQQQQREQWQGGLVPSSSTSYAYQQPFQQQQAPYQQQQQQLVRAAPPGAHPLAANADGPQSLGWDPLSATAVALQQPAGHLMPGAAAANLPVSRHSAV